MSEDVKKEEVTKEQEEKTASTQNFVKMDVQSANDMIINVDGKDGRVYRFSMPFNSPLPECYNAAINAANEIARIFNEAVKKQVEKEADEKKPEENSVPEVEKGSEEVKV